MAAAGDPPNAPDLIQLVYSHPELIETFAYQGNYTDWPPPVTIATPLGDINIQLWVNVPGIGPVGTGQGRC